LAIAADCDFDGERNDVEGYPGSAKERGTSGVVMDSREGVGIQSLS